MEDLAVKTLHKAVDWIVSESNEDICQICALYKTKEFEALAKKNDGEEPCCYKRMNGTKACRNGLIKNFEKSV